MSSFLDTLLKSEQRSLLGVGIKQFHQPEVCFSPEACPTLGPFSASFGSSSHPGVAASVLLFLSSYVGVDGFLSNISLGSSQGWYFRVTQFELIFLGLLMLQICVLRYIDILPINLNNWFVGNPTGRRRRNAGNNDEMKYREKFCKKDELAESMMQVLKKLDDEECLPLVLCQLEGLTRNNVKLHELDYTLPRETTLLLNALKLSSINRRKYIDEQNCESSSQAMTLKHFEDAVVLGDDFKAANSTVCLDRYRGCPLSLKDVVSYVGILVKAEML